MGGIEIPKQEWEETMSNRIVIGLDLAKQSTATAALDGQGREQWRRTFRRQKLLPFLAR